MLFAGRGHRCHVAPRRVRSVEVDHLGGRGGGIAPAHDQDLAVGVHRRRPVRPLADVPVAEVRPRQRRIPRAGARRVEVARPAVRAGVEHLSVRRQVHPGVQRQPLLRRSQVPVTAGRRLPHLRQQAAMCMVVLSRHHQHIAVPQHGRRRVPASLSHLGQRRPGVRERIEDARVLRAEGVHVVHRPAGYEHPPVGQEHLTGAEDVVASEGRVDGLAGRRIPDPGGRVTEPSRPVHHLAVRQHMGVHRTVHPRQHRRPLPGCADAERRRRRSFRRGDGVQRVPTTLDGDQRRRDEERGETRADVTASSGNAARAGWSSRRGTNGTSPQALPVVQ